MAPGKPYRRQEWLAAEIKMLEATVKALPEGKLAVPERTRTRHAPLDLTRKRQPARAAAVCKRRYVGIYLARG